MAVGGAVVLPGLVRGLARTPPRCMLLSTAACVVHCCLSCLVLCVGECLSEVFVWWGILCPPPLPHDVEGGSVAVGGACVVDGGWYDE